MSPEDLADLIRGTLQDNPNLVLYADVNEDNIWLYAGYQQVDPGGDDVLVMEISL